MTPRSVPESGSVVTHGDGSTLFGPVGPAATSGARAGAAPVQPAPTKPSAMSAAPAADRTTTLVRAFTWVQGATR